MTASLRDTAFAPPFTIGAQIARDDFAALSAILLKALTGAAGVGRSVAPASFSAEFTIADFPDQPVEAVAHVERATRTLIFVAAECRNQRGDRLAVASGVFKVAG